ncbi:MAG: helix-turn-helix transcriptional regulator, partial [Deltaproteobacteria bacterium]|nr:helix-turn-helix transcriptional regulator [Deltaproteobacteria bacterium]
MDKDFFLTAQDVATRLKIAKNTVYELVKREELNYYKVGRKIRFTINDIESYISHSRGSVTPIKLHEKNPRSQESSFIICGQDAMLDVLTAFLERYNGLEKPTLRAYIGSYKGLIALYQGEVQMATSHLWDGDSDVYNLPFVRRLLPGIACVLIHLTYRTQGFYVTK